MMLCITTKEASSHITVRTLQRIFDDACSKAEIKKDIQERLRHKSSKTTEIYTHVNNRDSGKIKVHWTLY